MWFLRAAALLAPSLLGVASGDGTGFCPDDTAYTGYLPAGPEAEYFYYVATSRSATPSKDPLVLWLTGGPGCSSILALLMENGPCKIKGRSADGEWELERNPWSWNEAANVLWVDQPVGVGYSNTGSDLVGTEKQVGERMHAFMVNFYKRYPQYLEVPVYVTGESYGGHYVPAVAVHLLRGQGPGMGVLRGIAVGNGEVDPAIQFASKPVMAYTGGVGGSLGKGVIDKETYVTMEQNLPKCEAEIRRCQQTPTPMDCVISMAMCTKDEVVPVASTGVNPYDLRKECITGEPKGSPLAGLCYNVENEVHFLNDPAIKRKIGVPLSRTWAPCNMTSTVPFILSGDSMMNYRDAVIELLAGGVHVLVYAGDCDFMVDWIGCRAWVQQLPWAHQQAWLQAPQDRVIMAGRQAGVKQASHNLTYIQVHQAGHLVPHDQPEYMLKMLQDLLAETGAGHGAATSLSSPVTGRTVGFPIALAVAATSAFVGLALVRVRASKRELTGKPGYWLMA